MNYLFSYFIISLFLCFFITCSLVRLFTCSIFCQRQKIPPRGIEPLKDKTHSIDNKELTKSQEPVFAVSLGILLQKYPDLKVIVEAWPNLSEDIKATIKTLINTHKAIE